MKNAFLLSLFLFTVALYAQEHGSISGNIMDNELYNEPLVFANIELKNTSFQTQTNFRGNFEIEGITPGSYTLIVRYPGYESLELHLLVKQNEITRIQKELSAIKINLIDLISEETRKDELGIKITANLRQGRK